MFLILLAIRLNYVGYRVGSFLNNNKAMFLTVFSIALKLFYYGH